MTSNGRVDIIIQRLDRIESKIDEQRRELAQALDEHRRDTAEDVSKLHARINKANESVNTRFEGVQGHISKTESRVARVEVIGGMLQTVWAALVGWLFQRG